MCVHVCVYGGGGGGGGTYLNNRDQIINVGMIRYAGSEDTQGRVSKLRRVCVKWGNCCERLGDAPPEEFSNLKALKCHSSTLKPIAVSNRFRKLSDRYFLNFDKKSVYISCNIC